MSRATRGFQGYIGGEGPHPRAPTRSPPPPPYTGYVRLVLLILLLMPAASAATSCADRPLILFHNYREERVAVHIDGDRVLILRPHTAEGLPYQVAAWTWPREIEVRDQVNEPILRFRASAGDLALQHWRVDIR